MGVNTTAVVHFCNLKFSHIFTSSSKIDELKSIAKSRWTSLRNSDFYFCYTFDGNKVCLKLDFQLQSMICYCIIHNVDSIDLSIEFVGDSCSSMVESADYDGVVDDDLAEDTATAFIEDIAQVSRPRRLKDWENVIGDVGQRFVGGVDVVRSAVDKHCIFTDYPYAIVKSAPYRYTVKDQLQKN